MVQMLTYAAEAGHTRLALRAWECMEYALLPTELPSEGELALMPSCAIHHSYLMPQSCDDDYCIVPSRRGSILG